MLLERIRLQGFLSHYGTVGDDGVLGPTVLDFSDADLWLVHGPNGAGKSAAVFDAIGFALYKQHRAGKSGAAGLVHQDASSAFVSVDVDLGGQRYRISRTIKKSGLVTGRLAEADGEGWTGIEFEGRLEDWVERALGMPFTTFQACILLRQGEADSFLKAKGAARRAALFDLVRLTEYKTLEGLAQTRYKAANAERARLEAEIADSSDVSPEALEALNQQHAAARHAFAEAAERRGQAAAAVEHVAKAATLLSTIQTQRDAIARHEGLLGRAEEIEARAARHTLLKAALPALKLLHSARARQAGTEAEIATLTSQQATLDGLTASLGDRVQTAQAAHAEAKTAASTAAAEATALGERLAASEARATLIDTQVQNHTNVGAAEACPLCAANLDNEDAQHRVSAHYDALRATLGALRESARNTKEDHQNARDRHAVVAQAETRGQTALAAATSDAEAHQRSLGEMPARISKAQAELNQATTETADVLASLAADWQAHAAAHDPEALRVLSVEAEALQDAPDAKRLLDQARQDAAPAQQTLSGATAQLEQIPMPLRHASLDAVTASSDDAEVAEREADSAAQTALKAVGAMENSIRQIEKMTSDHDAYAQAAGRYKRLADAFGPKQLQARVLRDAQVRVMQNANKTLAQLTNGGWAITLDDSGDELAVLACDPLGNVRPFEYLSGGERFRVSLALAVGVGQTVSGGHSVRSLLIDEGFGALDDDGRALMVEELHRLRETVLDGGRVVVVAHQDDVKDQFGYRFEVSKPVFGPGRGRAVVTRSTPGEDL